MSKLRFVPLYLFISVAWAKVDCSQYFKKVVSIFDRQGVVKVGFISELNELNVGDLLELAPQDYVEVKGLLTPQNAGNFNFAIDIGKNKVARVMKYPDQTQSLEEVQDFIMGYDVLKDHGIPVPIFYKKLSRPPYKIIVDKIDVKFRLDEFLAGPEKFKEFDRTKVWEDLKVFARKTAMFDSIGDFHDKQLVYDGKRWVLIDFGKDTKLADRETSRTNAFQFARNNLNSMRSLPHSVFLDLNKAIAEERRLLGFTQIQDVDQIKEAIDEGRLYQLDDF